MRKGILADFLIPLLAAVAATGAIDLAGADLAVQALFYSPGAGWVLGNREPWAFLYQYGNIPAFALGAHGGDRFRVELFLRAVSPRQDGGAVRGGPSGPRPRSDRQHGVQGSLGQAEARGHRTIRGSGNLSFLLASRLAGAGTLVSLGTRRRRVFPHGALLRAQAQGARMGAKGPGGRHPLRPHDGPGHG